MTTKQLGDSIAVRCGATFRVLRRRKVLGEFIRQRAAAIGFWSPWAKRQSEGSYWIDITDSQKSTLGAYSLAIVSFRLEGKRNSFFWFDKLESHRSMDCMQFNSHEGNHWKLRVRAERGHLVIKLQGGRQSTIQVEDGPCQLVKRAVPRRRKSDKEDPILALRGLGKAIRGEETPDQYVRRVRKDWEGV